MTYMPARPPKPRPDPLRFGSKLRTTFQSWHTDIPRHDRVRQPTSMPSTAQPSAAAVQYPDRGGARSTQAGRINLKTGKDAAALPDSEPPNRKPDRARRAIQTQQSAGPVRSKPAASKAPATTQQPRHNAASAMVLEHPNSPSCGELHLSKKPTTTRQHSPHLVVWARPTSHQDNGPSGHNSPNRHQRRRHHANSNNPLLSPPNGIRFTCGRVRPAEASPGCQTSGRVE
jgi:hypothetical protein